MMRRTGARCAAGALIAVAMVAGCFSESESEAPDAIVTITRDELRARDPMPDQLQRIDNGDGTWSYDLPDGFDPDLRVVGKMATWRYDGQARFAFDPEPVKGPRSFIVKEEKERSLDDKMSSLVRIDWLGRRWKVVAIDREALRETGVSDEQRLIADQPQPSRSVPLEPEPEPGTRVTWQPTSWSHYDCDQTGGNETHLWDGESRLPINGAPTNREQTAVLLENWKTGYQCSAVIVGDGAVLTAAHCVSDDNNQPINPGDFIVTRYWDGEIRIVSDIDFDEDHYTGGDGQGLFDVDFADDWAILETWGDWYDVRMMKISAAGDSTLSALERVHNLSFPKFAPTCTGNFDQLFLNREDEPIAGIGAKKLRLKIDLSPRQSGSPFYYCPQADNDTCASNQQGYVIGVTAGYNSASKRTIGPKASSFRDQALAFIND